MMSTNRLRLLGLALLVMGVCVLYVFLRPRPPNDAPRPVEVAERVGEAPAHRVTLEDLGDSAVERVEPPRSPLVAADLPKFRSWEDALKDFWGDQWPEVSARLKEQGQDYSSIPAEDLVPWESVLPEVCERMRMADSTKRLWMRAYLADAPMTLDYIKEKLGITDIELRPEHLLEIDVILEESTRRGLAAFANVESAINVELNHKCGRGDYYYGPFTTAPAVRRRRDPALFEYAYNVQGWNIKCTVWQDEVPHVKDDMEILKGMNRIQRPLISKYIAAIRKR